MTTPELLSYIKGEIAKGTSKDSITSTLTTGGWQVSDVEEAFAIISPTPTVITPQAPPIASQEPIVSNFPRQSYQQPSYQAPASMPRSRSHAWAYAFVILFLLVAGGSAAFAYKTGYFISPEKKIAILSSNLKSATSVTFDILLKGEGVNKKNTTQSLDKNSFTLKLKGSTVLNTDSSNTSIEAELHANTFNAQFEIRVIGQMLYATLRGVSYPPLPDISQYYNKWLSVNYEDKSGVASVPYSQPLSYFEKLKPEEKEYITNLWKEISFAKDVTKKGTEQMNGMTVDRYSFSLDKDSIKAYLIKVKEFTNSASVSDQSVSKLDPVFINSEIDRITNFTGEIWIGKKDNMPYRLDAAFSIEPDSTSGMKETGQYNISVLLSNWNQPITTQKPEGAVDIKDFFAPVYSVNMTKAKDAMIKASLANMRAFAELYYDDHYQTGTNYKGFCATADSKKIFEKIEKETAPTKVTCRDQVNSYISYAPLSNGSIFCIDSNGSAKVTTEQLPTAVLCK